ncbi:hypothetical protein Cni_G25046 [Canna indica]|uniref:Uncharacterized protein n=1 Tax=Canna indica TaxID=4628 RepID=A0AAQ3QM00_9LILI|nr:hypothetical protein Cni_G25046 [Canna indica]
MISGCKSSHGCVDSRVPVRATYVNLYKWPESDVEFVKSMTRRERGRGRADDSNGSGIDTDGNGRRKWSAAPAVVDSYSCRQMYLRSYQFSRKETVPEKTLRCLGRVKEKTATLSFLHHKSESSVGDANSKEEKVHNGQRRRRRKKQQQRKAFVATRKLRDMSCSTLCFIFRRLLSCAATVGVVSRE